MAISSEQLRRELLANLVNRPIATTPGAALANIGQMIGGAIAGRRQLRNLEARETADRIGEEVRLRDALIGSGLDPAQAGGIASAPRDVRGALLGRIPRPPTVLEEETLGAAREERQARREERTFARRQREAAQGLAQRVLGGEFGELSQAQQLDALVAAQTGNAGALSGILEDTGQEFAVVGNKDQGLFRFNKQTGQLDEIVPAVSPEPDRTERAKLTASLRKEAAAIPAVKNYREALPAVKAGIDSIGLDTKAADLDIVFSVMKAIDPTSVVRESEQQVAVEAGSPAQRFEGLFNSVVGGGRLSAAQRRDLMDVALGRMRAYRGSAVSDLEQFQGIADEAGVTPTLTIPELEELPKIGVVSSEGVAEGGLPERPVQVFRFDEQGNVIP